ncbi:MAG: DUF1425 domain-containing protein [Phycisphaeraceae bacterium]|nr:DUF1425 domain-containing protein [Phycisphaeraceae bacterium]
MKHTTWPVAILMLIALGLFSPGCRRDNIMAPNVPPPDPVAPGAYPQVVLLGGLERQLVIHESPHVTRTGQDLLRARVTLRSVVDRNLVIHYRFIFESEDGEQIGAAPTWRQTTVNARTLVRMDGNALSRRATRWRLEVRP